ncbi:MAG TPA: DUF4252 domain-containing protein [Bryobacteraceae bacterium]|nr:DUF4252 domain-containing protein [Bryobacteraceae bacterium]
MKCFILLAAAAAAFGQQIDLSKLEHLASKAKESTNVSLDPEKLKMASGLLGESGDAKNLVLSMQGVHVRTFEFERPGEFSSADLEPIRSQLKGPNWSRIVDVKSKDEAVEIWFYMTNGRMGGMTLIAAEARELSVINIVGALDMQSLGQLTRQLGLGGGVALPGMNDAKPRTDPKPAPKPSPRQQDDDNDDFGD